MVDWSNIATAIFTGTMALFSYLQFRTPNPIIECEVYAPNKTSGGACRFHIVIRNRANMRISVTEAKIVGHSEATISALTDVIGKGGMRDTWSEYLRMQALRVPVGPIYSEATMLSSGEANWFDLLAKGVRTGDKLNIRLTIRFNASKVFERRPTITRIIPD